MTDLLDPGPPLTAAGERLLAAATELFYRRGIRAVGVDLIAEVAGTTKKTLYDRFGSKDDLVALYLRRRARRWQVFLEAGLDGVPAGPGRALAVFDVLESWLADQDRGCAFVNAHAEIGGSDHPGVPVIREEKRWMRDRIVALVREAGVADADGVGRQVHQLYEGAAVLVTAAGQDDAVGHARDAAARLLS